MTEKGGKTCGFYPLKQAVMAVNRVRVVWQRFRHIVVRLKTRADVRDVGPRLGVAASGNIRI